jgi:hypothetical protein
MKIVFPVVGLLSLFSLIAMGDDVTPSHPYLNAHSHNDYEQARPLYDALDNHFGSVEADIWYIAGDLLVSHLGFDFKGSLKNLYLDPLQKEVNDHAGSVYGEGSPIYLWIDIKDPSAELRAELHEELSHYPMITQFSNSGIKLGAVTVILTGDESSKAAYVAEHDLRYATRDSNDLSSSDSVSNDNRWTWYALSWRDHFDPYGLGMVSPAQVADQLKSMVFQVHKKNRKLRIYDSPDTFEYWKVAQEAGVDMISSDHLNELNQYLSLHPGQMMF